MGTSHPDHRLEESSIYLLKFELKSKVKKLDLMIVGICADTNQIPQSTQGAIVNVLLIVNCVENCKLLTSLPFRPDTYVHFSEEIKTLNYCGIACL